MSAVARTDDVLPALRTRRVLSAGLAAAMVGATAAQPMLHLAANRLVVGTPVTATSLGAPGALVALLILLGGAFMGAERSRRSGWTALLAFSAALVLFAALLGAAASDAIAGQPSAARARLASGAWTGLVLLAGATAAAASGIRTRGVGWLTLAGLSAAFAMLLYAGTFDGLSLMVEYSARSASLHAALAQHVVLSVSAVLLAALCCALLHAWRRARGTAEIVISGLQVVPAVALLGGVVALTSALLSAIPSLRTLGLSALGPGPAILVIAGYLLLPFWRGLQAALRAPDPASLDAAEAIGLSPRQILTGLRLPLGAPLLVGALRVASVQSIGLATLGALVGAGGLGVIVFDGMAQFAPDLILLGALPVIGLSLIAERGLSRLEDHLRRRWRG